MTVERKRGGRRLISKAHSFGLEIETLYTDEELEFLRAIDRYKSEEDRPFPTWSEVFAVFQKLGYRKESGTTSIHGH